MPRARAQGCYWGHATAAAGRYPCIDGASLVCARCCVEQCAVQSPGYFAACAAAGHPTWPAVVRGGAVPAKLVCLESYWNEELHDPWPALRAIHASVLRDFRPARALGLKLVLRGD